MATKIFMEALSPTMEEGRLVKWNIPEGAAVKSGDVLAEVETDKAVMELVARGDGVLRKQLVAEGVTAPVGSLVGVIAGADEDIAALVAGAGAAPAAVAPAAAVPAAPAAAPAPAAVLAAAPAPAAPSAVAGAVSTKSSPLARRLARESGLDVGAIPGSGPGGRVIKRDIEAAMAGGASAISRPSSAVSAADYTDQPLTQIRKTIARRLGESIGPIPTFYLTAEFDLTRVVEMRAQAAALGEDFKVSVNDILLKAVATALAAHPEVNAHWLGDKIRYFNRVHLGMAVATDDGLIVPVIFDADRKGLREISVESRDLAKRARERKLTPEQYTGSTFSVSNLGMMQIDQFTAIINPPECGILAIGAIEDTPVVVDDAIAVRKRLRVTMSCDHRVIDGAVGARFLQTLRRMLENPLMLVF
ncbi:MAG TPA: dihydrolipoamide acetyltransferase family protein [Gemmatimonadaceae bacterium]|jgi:pyruvate dehydrogenase E2 component (dihydrolipoamide acetyltransferase)